MPFGISSAPEVFQKKMHELIEGLQGIEIVADDFVVVGCGNTVYEANVDHDKRLHSFLQRCEERGVKLNVDKFKLRQEEVWFIGHVATSDGPSIDPTKVKAIVDMPNPTDVPGVQRLLGLAQYLAKFLPHLSDITKPLRDLTRNDTEWMWESSQQNALDTLKKAVASTPVLRYYNLADEVTIQCDASQSGLGAELMQTGQPVAYASRALTPPETRYAQIENELLAIVFACDRFEAYIYGRDRVSIESDHNPLEMIVLKPLGSLSSAPKRLQRMLLQLQKYTLDVKYKKGEHMYLADTLSRAYIPEVNVCDFVHELEELDHRESLPVSQERWQQLNHASENDNVCQQLRATIQNGWPENKSEVPECVLPYYDSRDELTIQGNMIFKGQLLVVPAAVRTELMSVAHASRIGIEGCLRRMRECLYWPRMTTQVKDYISKYVCRTVVPNRRSYATRCVRLLQQLHWSSSLEHGHDAQCGAWVVADVRQIWSAGCPCHGQRATICISRVCRVREAERYYSRDILTTLRTEQRKIWECGEDAETTLCQSQTEWWVHGATRLEKYTIRRYEHESCSTTHGSTV